MASKEHLIFRTRRTGHCGGEVCGSPVSFDLAYLLKCCSPFGRFEGGPPHTPFALFTEPMSAALANLRELARPPPAFAAFQGQFLSAFHSPAAEKMDKKENDGNDKKKVNKRGGNMEDDECPHPRKEQKKRDSKKYKSHKIPSDWQYYHASAPNVWWSASRVGPESGCVRLCSPYRPWRDPYAQRHDRDEAMLPVIRLGPF